MAARTKDKMAGDGTAQRLDKWLWYTRVVKSRTLAGALIERGKVRVNRGKVSKASHTVKPGDVITATVSRKVRILKVVALGHRRGPFAEAQELYEDLTPADNVRPSTSASQEQGSSRGGVSAGGAVRAEAFARAPGAGRPTKRDRRLIDRFKQSRNDR